MGSESAPFTSINMKLSSIVYTKIVTVSYFLSMKNSRAVRDHEVLWFA
jgi:hypothetical protein